MILTEQKNELQRLVSMESREKIVILSLKFTFTVADKLL
jgi:hypothetical protein